VVRKSKIKSHITFPSNATRSTLFAMEHYICYINYWKIKAI